MGYWSFFFFVALFTLVLRYQFQERIYADCTIHDRGGSFSETGNIPNVRCTLSNGYSLIVTKDAHKYKVGEIIRVYTLKSNTE
jgi:hypothetical protein